MELRPKGRVLVVDDDEATMVLVCRMLTRLGYEARGALDGKEALRHLAEDPGLRFVLTDINMPGMDGWELARRIREHHPDLQILALTGLSPEEIMPRIRTSAIREAFFKPLSLEALRDNLARCLEPDGAADPRRGSG